MLPSNSILILYSCASFLLGAVPSGKLVARAAASLDITKVGSCNIGATNVAREAGLRWGILTLALDATKGFVPVFLFLHFFSQSEIGLSTVALATLVGHQYSIFLKFHGGKGVATALGIFLAVSPLQCLIAIGIFAFAVYFSGFVSVGSMLSACIMPILLLASGEPITIALSSVIISVLICFRHKDNIKRLLTGRENHWPGKNLS